MVTISCFFQMMGVFSSRCCFGLLTVIVAPKSSPVQVMKATAAAALPKLSGLEPRISSEFVAAFARSPAVVSFYDSFCWMFLGDCEGIQVLTGLYWFESLE